MDKEELTDKLVSTHKNFEKYLLSLSTEELHHKPNGKWSAFQQLAHIVVCLKPLVQVYGMPTNMIAMMFGRSEEDLIFSYNDHVAAYEAKLAAGGKAPAQFWPENVQASEVKTLCKILEDRVLALTKGLRNISEEDLNALQIPHPLLGEISLREMLYNAIYHVQHHHKQAELNLQLT